MATSLVLNSADEICITKSCIEIAASLLQSIDMNVDPCSDFYKYTCGSWIKNAVIPEELAGFGILEVESVMHKDQFRTILEGEYHDLLHATTSHSSFQVTTKKDREKDEETFQVIKNYYTSCVDIESTGYDAFKPFFSELKQLTTITTTEAQKQLRLTPSIIDVVSYPRSGDGIAIEVGGLFSIEFVPDDNDKSKMALGIMPPYSFQELDVAPLTDIEFETLYRTIHSVLGYSNATERDRERLNVLYHAGLQPLASSDIYSMMDNALSVQKRLFRLTKAWNDPGYFSYNIKGITEAFSFIDWKNIFKHYIPQGQNFNDLNIQVYNSDYFNQLNHYTNLDDPTRVLHKDSIADYLLVNKIYQEAPILDADTRKLVPDNPFQTRSGICVDKVLENFGLVSGRFYSMITFEGEEDRIKLEEMAESIKDSLGDHIKKSDWLDEATRVAAMNKLHAMTKTIGYSTANPDQRSPYEMNEYLDSLDTSASTFYENEKTVAEWVFSKYWGTIGRSMSPTEWIGVATPQIVNAFNLLPKNSIVVSASFAQKPNYDRSYPDYLNYGGIGQTLGHEFSHGFDDVGSQFDADGIERDWWSEETKQKYTQKTKCFVSQYSKEFIRDDDGHKYKIDGSLTLGENIADNEGLAASFDAFKKLKESGKGYNPILPGLQNFSDEALFFINAGRSFCSKPLPGTVKDYISDEHAPDSIRANKLFQNNPDFARIFKCPVGSKMNPKGPKCKIW
ncbi:hypothetical protein EDC96DRAFT_588764 [Choanephora cucurbitarum]|nr:hypothetical protein EDC96DRAFT_588764 [Choanephora cucurbitarum]